MNAMRGAIVGVLLAALLATGAEGAAVPGRLVCEQDTLRADDQLQWTPLIMVINTGTRGLYVDSLWLEVRAASGKTSRFDLQTLVRGLAPISVGDSSLIRLNIPADVERGTATLVMVAHDGDQTRVRDTARLVIDGGALDAHVSHRSRAADRMVEWIRVPAEPSAVPAAGAPGVVLVHGEGGDARGLLRTARLLSSQGFAVVCVSLPGAGGSDGPVDFMGPASRRAVLLALDSLAASPSVDREHLGIWGVSAGASVALLAALERPSLSGVVAQSANYDLFSSYRRMVGTPLAAELARSVGTDSSEWKSRSPLPTALSVKARVLVLHGDADTVAPVSEARDFAARRFALGLPGSEQFLKSQPHDLPRGAAQRHALAFLRDALGLTRP